MPLKLELQICIRRCKCSKLCRPIGRDDLIARYFSFFEETEPLRNQNPCAVAVLCCSGLNGHATCGVWSHFVSLHRTAQNNSIIYLAGQGFKSLALTLDF